MSRPVVFHSSVKRNERIPLKRLDFPTQNLSTAPLMNSIQNFPNGEPLIDSKYQIKEQFTPDDKIESVKNISTLYERGISYDLARDKKSLYTRSVDSEQDSMNTPALLKEKVKVFEEKIQLHEGETKRRISRQNISNSVENKKMISDSSDINKRLALYKSKKLPSVEIEIKKEDTIIKPERVNNNNTYLNNNITHNNNKNHGNNNNNNYNTIANNNKNNLMNGGENDYSSVRKPNKLYNLKINLGLIADESSHVKEQPNSPGSKYSIKYSSDKGFNKLQDIKLSLGFVEESRNFKNLVSDSSSNKGNTWRKNLYDDLTNKEIIADYHNTSSEESKFINGVENVQKLTEESEKLRDQDPRIGMTPEKLILSTDDTFSEKKSVSASNEAAVSATAASVKHLVSKYQNDIKANSTKSKAMVRNEEKNRYSLSLERSKNIIHSEFTQVEINSKDSDIRRSSEKINISSKVSSLQNTLERDAKLKRENRNNVIDNSTDEEIMRNSILKDSNSEKKKLLADVMNTKNKIILAEKLNIESKNLFSESSDNKIPFPEKLNNDNPTSSIRQIIKHARENENNITNSEKCIHENRSITQSHQKQENKNSPAFAISPNFKEELANKLKLKPGGKSKLEEKNDIEENLNELNSYESTLREFDVKGKLNSNKGKELKNESKNENTGKIFSYKIGQKSKEEEISDWVTVDNVVVKTRAEVEAEKRKQMKNSNINDLSISTPSKEFSYEFEDKTDENFSNSFSTVKEPNKVPGYQYLKDKKDANKNGIAKNQHTQLESFISKHLEKTMTIKNNSQPENAKEMRYSKMTSSDSALSSGQRDSSKQEVNSEKFSHSSTPIEKISKDFDYKNSKLVSEVNENGMTQNEIKSHHSEKKSNSKHSELQSFISRHIEKTMITKTKSNGKSSQLPSEMEIDKKITHGATRYRKQSRPHIPKDFTDASVNPSKHVSNQNGSYVPPPDYD